MNEKELFIKAYKNNELKDFFKGSNGYMIYPDDAWRFMEPKKSGTGNLMYYIFKHGIVPACKDYPQFDFGNKVIDVLNEMVLDSSLEDFYAGVKATSTILENDMDSELSLNSIKFNKLLEDMKISITSREQTLKNTLNFLGNISFYEEFIRMNDTMTNGRKFL